MSVLHLFIAILAILSVSTIVSIVTWILQARISARIGVLETELVKKTAEFDSIRKERASIQVQAPIVDMSTQFEEPIEQQLVDDGEIRIMRNVHGTFSEALDEPPPDPFQEGRLKSTATEQYPPEPRTPQEGPSAEQAYPDDTKRGRQKTPASASLPPQASKPVTSTGTPVILQLLSPATGGADFNALYNNLMELIKSGSNQGIAFDCGGIQFLSDAEIEYLEKMCLSLVSQNRSTQIINCSDALRPLLQQRRQLAPFVR
ncbi:MAG: hypothetical protein JXA71_03945 [Chitinispirillaceae bacterium]|nr:hypothetical protein [Chitinispirillaceae bacterium]